MAARTRSRILALATVLAVAASGCSSSSEEPSQAAAGPDTPGVPAAVPGFDGTTVRLGAVTASSGPLAGVGGPLLAGARAYFGYVNTELGGIGGMYEVELDARDAAGDPSLAAEHYDALRDSVVMLAQVVGTPAVEALLDRLAADDVLASPWLYPAPDQENLLPVGTPLAVQAANALQWFVDQQPGAVPTACAVVQDDAYGDAARRGFELAVTHLDVQAGPSTRLPAPPSPPGDLAAVIGRLQTETCDAVVLATAPDGTAAVLAQAQHSGFEPQWLGLSDSFTTPLASLPIAPYAQANLVVVGDGPSYGDRRVDGMLELVRIRDAYAPTQAPDPAFVAGFVQAATVTAVLDRALELGDLSRQGILTARATLGRLDLDGLVTGATYGPVGAGRPALRSSIFRVDASNPIGLVRVAARVQAPFAGELLDP